jgi:hypothetical protein
MLATATSHTMPIDPAQQFIWDDEVTQKEP